MPGLNLPETPWDWLSADKLGHAGVYAVLSFLLLRGARLSGYGTAKVVFGVILGCGLYGILMELAQFYFFPGRHFEYLDMLANIIGAFLGWIIFRIFTF